MSEFGNVSLRAGKLDINAEQMEKYVAQLGNSVPLFELPVGDLFTPYGVRNAKTTKFGATISIIVR